MGLFLFYRLWDGIWRFRKGAHMLWADTRLYVQSEGSSLQCWGSQWCKFPAMMKQTLCTIFPKLKKWDFFVFVWLWVKNKFCFWIHKIPHENSGENFCLSFVICSKICSVERGFNRARNDLHPPQALRRHYIKCKCINHLQWYF